MFQRLLPVLFLFAPLVGACVPEAEEAPDPPSGFVVTVRPSTAAPGQVRTFEVQVPGAGWVPGETAVQLGPDLHAVGITTVRSDTLQIVARVDGEAGLGARGLQLAWGDQVVGLDEAIFIEPGAVELRPGRVPLGASRFLELSGFGTSFEPGRTWVSFSSPDVEAWSVDVRTPTNATVEVVVSGAADPGLVDCFVQDGSSTYSLHGCLLLDRTAVVAELEPQAGYQGTRVPFELIGRGTAWRRGFTELDLGTGITIELGEQDDDDHRVEANRIEGVLQLANAAPIGWRDLHIRTIDSDGEVVARQRIDEAFEVLWRPPDSSRARGALSIRMGATWDPDSCSWEKGVAASASFYEPLDPPCTAAPSSGVTTFAAPQRYDYPSVGYIAAPGTSDCPSPQTFDAGPFVWFEHPDHVLQLQRRRNPYTGRVYYFAPDLQLDDYRPDLTYALRVPGAEEEDDGLAPFYVEDAIRTLPALWELTGPDLCLDLELSLGQGADLDWTLTYTHDDLNFYFRMQGPPDANGTPTFMVYPYDDGHYFLSPETLSEWPVGGSSMLGLTSRYNYWALPTNTSGGTSGFSSSLITHRAEFNWVD